MRVDWLLVGIAIIAIMAVVGLYAMGLYEKTVDVQVDNLNVRDRAIDVDGVMIYFADMPGLYEGWTEINANKIPIIVIDSDSRTNPKTRTTYWHEKCHLGKMLAGELISEKGALALGLEEMYCTIIGMKGFFVGVPYAG